MTSTIEWPVELPPINLWSYPPRWLIRKALLVINEHDLKDWKEAGYSVKESRLGSVTEPPKSANAKQVGGTHYQNFKYAPWDVVLDWNLGYLDGTALKYIARWKEKNGIEDIKKAIHFLEKLVEVYERT